MQTALQMAPVRPEAEIFAFIQTQLGAQAQSQSHCSPNVEFLMVKCRPCYLPRELSSIIVTVVYTLPDANAKLPRKELHAAISKQQATHPEAAFIAAGDF